MINLLNFITVFFFLARFSPVVTLATPAEHFGKISKESTKNFLVELTNKTL